MALREIDMDINTGIADQIEEIKSAHPENLMAKTFDIEKFNRLDASGKDKVLKIIASGLENPRSSVGAYAMSPSDYEEFDWVLDPIVRGYHHVSADFRQEEDWNVEGSLDLREIDPELEDVSMRVRVARNSADFPLPGAMTREDRVNFENQMVEVFQSLISDSDFGGRYVSLTPGSDFEIDNNEYDKLVAGHKMFKDMSADSYLRSAGISADWPYGRGMYESQNGEFIVWVGEEDHLRIISMKKGSDLSVVFNNLSKLLNAVEGGGVNFAKSAKYGNVTSCPSNLGTGMRASVHVPFPNLARDEATMKRIAKNHGLSVRGMGGEHTAYGENGMVDISPSARLGKTEAEILGALYSGIKEMLQEEQKAA